MRRLWPRVWISRPAGGTSQPLPQPRLDRGSQATQLSVLSAPVHQRVQSRTPRNDQPPAEWLHGQLWPLRGYAFRGQCRDPAPLSRGPPERTGHVQVRRVRQQNLPELFQLQGPLQGETRGRRVCQRAGQQQLRRAELLRRVFVGGRDVL
uniref:(northern house mosquito) hypothetical protein n=1 Tax=Culex pipiens TaxID=7175 RepID=A0A8D8CLN1_CULPI